MVAHCSRSACQDAASATRARRATPTPPIPRQSTGARHVKPGRDKPGQLPPGRDRSSRACARSGRNGQATATGSRCTTLRRSTSIGGESEAIGGRTGRRSRLADAFSYAHACREQRLAAWLLRRAARGADRAPGFRPATVLGAYRRRGRGTGAGRRVRVRPERPLLLGPVTYVRARSLGRSRPLLRAYSSWCWLAGIRKELRR